MKILLENLLRHEDGGVTVGREHIEAVARWDAQAEPDTEIAFMPARVVLQDFTGVPCVVDLAAMRDAVVKLGGKASQINPLIPSELVIDHSVQVDVFGRPTRWTSTARSNSSATRSATASCAGARRPSATSRWCRRTPASSTR
jgi:aconitase A